MTTEQKLAHIQWYLDQIRTSNHKDTKLTYINRASGALGAWFADMTISHEHFNKINKELDIEFKALGEQV
ncbi:hypothetical protein phiPsa347_151 [Pseudomonas phage phiPsa347]|uniref:Uncharacterized protein n=1 Tax=Pseudomonas phage phiPsa347 TaxID=1460364 RepID=A0A7G9V2K7_9CAUD|nr:hypothetical protein QGX18_gp077 [Pseudomonas phage phiPsa347]QNO00513.1 hypothetical protein phiPsa347_151 [Pseudomonas phage phiPsa347]